MKNICILYVEAESEPANNLNLKKVEEYISFSKLKTSQSFCTLYFGLVIVNSYTEKDLKRHCFLKHYESFIYSMYM